LWYCSTRPWERGERLGHRRGQREVKNGHVARSGLGSPKGRHRGAAHRRSSGDTVGLVAHRAQQLAHARALSPMASPLCAAGTHWFTFTSAPFDESAAGRPGCRQTAVRSPGGIAAARRAPRRA
jgi:hypothetical protein